MNKKDWANQYLEDIEILSGIRSPKKASGGPLWKAEPGEKSWAKELLECLNSSKNPLLEVQSSNKLGLNSDFLNSEEIRELGIQCGDKCLLHKTCIVVNPGKISMGSNVRIDGFCTLSGGEYIELGSNIHIAGYVSLFGGAGIIVKDNASIASGSKVYSISDDIMGRGQVGPCVPEDTRYLHKQQVILGEHSVLAVNTVVLPGGSLGKGSTLLPFSVLTKSTGELEVWSGNAATFLKPRKDAFLKGKQ